MGLIKHGTNKFIIDATIKFCINSKKLDVSLLPIFALCVFEFYFLFTVVC